MNREEFIQRYNNFIEESKLYRLQCPVGAGGTLLLLGLREETSDIDMEIPKKEFEKYKKSGLYELSYFGKTEILKYDEYIDLHELDPSRSLMLIDSVCSWTPEEVLKFKVKMNRPKDQEDIKNLKKYLKENKGENHGY